MRIRKASIKTTLSGIGAILGGVAAIVTGATTKDGSTIISGITAIVSGVGLIAARDHNVSSEEAGIK